MSVSNIIEVTFGSSTLVFTEPYYKYNSGMYLKFSDLDLPESYQVHFANSVSETSLEMVGTSDGVLIPDDVWQSGATIYAWVYLHPTETSAVTKYEVRIPVSGRADLPDGTEPSEAEQTTIDTLVNALNTAVADAEQAKQDAEDARDESATNVTHYPIITDGYWYVWDAENSEYVNTNVKAEGENGEDGVGITSIEKTATSGLVDTYTVTFSDGITFDYTVTNGSNGTNGNGIASIEKTSTVDLVDTYTITYTDGTTSTYTVTNGEDGEVTQAQLDAVNADLSAEETRAKSEESRLEALFTTPTQEAVDNWLNEHPEATTTVQDGSLTEPKFSDALKLKTIKDYVTPEMYGAVGDGETDDTSSVQNAINNANGRIVYFIAGKTYKTTESINLGNTRIINHGTITYTGSLYAFIISPTENIDGIYYNIGTLIAPNGGCILLDSTNAWMQYVTFDFRLMRANGSKDIIRVNVVGNKWINEIRFINGRFNTCQNAVYIDHSQKAGNYFTSHWTFDKVGFEGCTTGVNLPDDVTRTSFTNCRAEESLSNIVYSRASTNAIRNTITWYGAIANGLYWRNCNNYFVLFSSGYIDASGTRVTYLPVIFNNGMLYGLRFDEGISSVNSNYDAYSYDSENNIQETDFAKVYDYTIDNQFLRQRPYVRRFTIINNSNATTTYVYLDDRMFLKADYGTANSFLLLMTLSPNKTIQIYDKKGGTLLQTITGTNVTTYPRLLISCAKNIYYIEQITIKCKQV